MQSAVKMLRMIQIALLVSIGMYVLVGELVGPHGPVSGTPTLFYGISVVSIMTIGVILVVRRTLVLHSESMMKSATGNTEIMQRWKTGYIVTYALSEALALFGLIVRLDGFRLSDAVTFYLPGFVLMLYFRPRQPASRFATE
jgi:hypothetical protein